MNEHETILFTGIDANDAAQLLACINARRVRYRKDEIIIEGGNHAHEFGIILEGSAQSLKWDASGRPVIITMLEKGGAFGVLLAAKPNSTSPLTVQATADSIVMQIPFAKMLKCCEKNCVHHEILIQNYIALLAEKGLELHERLNCLLEPTVREKILTYLKKTAREKSARTFIIPINRNIMAEYLNVERSALSRELSRMKKDGLIDYRRNSFKLHFPINLSNWA